MALDPRLECLPEHDGPALRTWQLIMQTTMGKVMKPVGFQFNSMKSPLLHPAEEFISLKDDDIVPENNGLEKKSKRKKSQSSESSEDSDDECPQNIDYAPWKCQGKYPESPYGLHMEIIDFYKYISPLPEEEYMRNEVVKRMTDLILSIWPAAKVEVFGSFSTNLYLPTSDIDLAVFGKWEKLPLFTIEKALISQGVADPASIKVLDKATVPIIKLTDKLSKIRVDISFNTESSVKSVEMVKSYIQEYDILPYLFMTLKHFLMQRDLNEVFTGGISSYCLMLLTVSFLQLHPRDDVKKEKHKVNLGVLLMEFFELYGRNFNYQRTGIKIRDGGRYISKTEIMKELDNGEYPALLCIEDPVTFGCDIGRSSYGILRVKEAFEYAFNVVHSALRNENYFKVNPNSTYLSRILSVPQDLIRYRCWVKETYDLSKISVAVPSCPIPSSPIYRMTLPQYPTNCRPALLPTPTSPYTQHVSVVTPPFSPYTTNSNVVSYSPVAFFGNNSIQRPQVILQNMANEKNTLIHTTELNRNLHSHSNDVSPLQMQQVGYVPGVFTTQQVEQIQPPTTPVYSPVKGNNTQTIENVFFSSSYRSNGSLPSSLYARKNNYQNVTDRTKKMNFIRSPKISSPRIASPPRRGSNLVFTKEISSSNQYRNLPTWLRDPSSDFNKGNQKNFVAENSGIDTTRDHEVTNVSPGIKTNDCAAPTNPIKKVSGNTSLSVDVGEPSYSPLPTDCDVVDISDDNFKSPLSETSREMNNDGNNTIFITDSESSEDVVAKERATADKNVNIINLVSSDESSTE